MNLKNIDPIILELETKLLKSILRLQKSFQKTAKLKPINDDSSDEDLEAWDSFAARFSRTTDIFLAKYLRARLYKLDPAFKGPLVDILNFATQNKLISLPEKWLAIRELQNKEAHEYTEESLQQFFETISAEIPFIIKEIEQCIASKKS
jgi:hypothetical protein